MELNKIPIFGKLEILFIMDIMPKDSIFLTKAFE